MPKQIISREQFFKRADFHDDMMRRQRDSFEREIINLGVLMFPELSEIDQVQLVFSNTAKIQYADEKFIETEERCYRDKYVFRMMCNYRLLEDGSAILYVTEFYDEEGRVCAYSIEDTRTDS